MNGEGLMGLVKIVHQPYLHNPVPHTLEDNLLVLCLAHIQPVSHTLQAIHVLSLADSPAPHYPCLGDQAVHHTLWLTNHSPAPHYHCLGYQPVPLSLAVSCLVDNQLVLPTPCLVDRPPALSLVDRPPVFSLVDCPPQADTVLCKVQLAVHQQ